jgi:glucosyltransferase
MKKISIIIPCYNEEEALPIYYDAMKTIMNDLKEVQFELIFIDDGSIDKQSMT